MDPRYLKSDELEYELALRQIALSDSDRMDTLIQVLGAEDAGVLSNPTDSARITRQTVIQEIKECELKLKEISEDSNEAAQCVDLNLTAGLQSRLLHLTGRVSRLKAVAANHGAVDRLVQRVKDVSGQIKLGRETRVNEEREASFVNLDPLGCVETTDKNKPNEPTTSKAVDQQEQAQVPPPASKGFTSRWFGSLSDVFNRASERDYLLEPAVSHAFHNLTMGAPEARQISYPKVSATGHPVLPTGTKPKHPQKHHSYGQSSPNDGRFFHNVSHTTNPQSRLNDVPQHDYLRQGVDAGQNGAGFFSGGHRIRQWSLRFSGAPGGLDAEDFLFRVERQAQLNGVSPAALVLGIGDLLTDRASQWYWTYQRRGEALSWEDLKDAFIRRFVPSRETDYDIRAKIESRKQRPNETFNDFCLDIESLAVRLNTRMEDIELIEVLRRNMTLQLRKALWRHPTRTVDSLISCCTEFEQMCSEEMFQNQIVQRRAMRVSELEEVQSMQNAQSQSRVATESLQGQVEAVQLGGSRGDMPICWNCKDIGHTFVQCTLPQQDIFCFSCGLKGVLRTQCTNVKCQGNVKRSAPTAGWPRSNQGNPQIFRQPGTGVQQPTGNNFQTPHQNTRP